MTQPLRALILTYHGIEPGPAPLFVKPELFAHQLEILRDQDATLITVSALVEGLRTGRLPPRAVALTFDDAFASVAEHAAPLLIREGWPATVYCVSGYIGRQNDWPTQPRGVPRRPLASHAQLRELVAAGWEIGAHTRSHVPLARLERPRLSDEIVGARDELEHVLGCQITSFACPYGDRPSPTARALIERSYLSCCSTRMGHAGGAAEAYELPRVDAHYLRRPSMFRRAVRGNTGHLTLRRTGARLRHALVSDFRAPLPAPRH